MNDDFPHGRRDPGAPPNQGSGGQSPIGAQLQEQAGRSLLDLFAGRKALALILNRDPRRPDNLTGYSLAIVDVTNPPDGMSPSSDTRSILAAIAGVAKQMTDTNTLTSAAIAKLVATDQTLATEIQALLDKLAGEPQAIADAVSAALTAAGATDAQNAAAVDAATAGAQALVDKIAAVFPPTDNGGGDAGGNTSGGQPAPTIVVTPTSIFGTVGQGATGAFVASGGTEPYQFVADGNAPAGFSVTPDGSWSITPGAAGTGAFDVVATDATGATSDTEVSFQFVDQAAS